MNGLFARLPWVPFLILALAAQQANMLTYKFGGQIATPQAFLVWSFLTQAVVNLGLAVMLKNRGFAWNLPSKMRLWVLVVAVVYLVNELTFVTVYRIGAPYSLMMTVFALSMMVLMTSIGVFYFKEKLNRKQVCGIVAATAAIILVRLG
jgi:hypothetical protein